MEFEKNFTFGAATAAYQIEGAYNKDGRTSSIWDEFCKIPGKIYNGDNGNEACNHYHLYKEDIKLMKELGINSYRFSISWPRIFPQKDVYNPEGMEFYKNLLRELKLNGIKAMATIYHWDLPQWAEELGGWGARDSVKWFTDYAGKCFEELDELVDKWITHNEPWCVSFLSNLMGVHAPGKRDLIESLKVAHHVLLSHGEAVKLYRSMNGKNQIGITLSLSPAYPKTNSYADVIAANNSDVIANRYFLEPLFKGSYPFEIANYAHDILTTFDFIHEGDLKTIAEKCDFLGVNYYSRSRVEFDSKNWLSFRAVEPEYPVTDMGWEVFPQGLIDLIVGLRKQYTNLPIYITENGCAYADAVDADGKIHDHERIDYYEKHLKAVAELNSIGMDVAGYYAWSLLDNFEWAYGYSKRFGLVYVDFETQRRIPKDSFYRFAEIINSRKI